MTIMNVYSCARSRCRPMAIVIALQHARLSLYLSLHVCRFAFVNAARVT